MTTPPATAYLPRIYPLDAHELTEEEIAVAFAMTSRSPDPFDEIAEQVSREKAADFHERWVLGYGHASVAEHAIVHLAVENVSRLAADALEDNRLASYTEKSSRYQVMPSDYFHVPAELELHPSLRSLYVETAQELFQIYQQLLDGCLAHLRQELPQRERERDGAYNLRLRRRATDSCRSVLPAATLTNVGLTANARVLEHAISKLMSGGLAEERQIGTELREQSRRITPTLIKYADRNQFLETVQRREWQLPLPASDSVEEPRVKVNLAHYDREAEEKIAAALLFQQFSCDYAAAWQEAQEMSSEARLGLIDALLENIGDHDAALREFELADYVFEFVMDYGAYREFKRHRMQSYFPQPFTPDLGYRIPQLLVAAGLEDDYRRAMSRAEAGYRRVAQVSPLAAQYLLTHGHNRRTLSRMNLRECYHLFKLRSSREAHEAVREPVIAAMQLAVEAQPQLFRWLRLRNYPDWWPFQ